MKNILSFIALLLTCTGYAGQNCDNNAFRAWWDVQHYNIQVSVDTANGYLDGYVVLEASVKDRVADTLQLDLQAPMAITAISLEGTERKTIHWVRQDNIYYLTGLRNEIGEKDFKLRIDFKGVPQVAHNAPWDGGIVLQRDDRGIRWMGIACQGNGASIWFPCKDLQGDEPDKGMQLTMTVPEGMTMVGNGKCLAAGTPGSKGKTTWSWSVRNPINNYNISFYIGDYVHWSDTLQGEKGRLDLDYYVLRDNLEKAQKQFQVVKPMLHCFEAKLGPYPFYEDGYKLVESPYLGMEHQSAVAYGNRYKMGYLGMDRSRTGAGLDFDYIIIHESGHEWFGNNITTFDKADTWIHEGFTTYTEMLFEECLKGKERAFEYEQGKKYIIDNDRPIQGQFGQCDEGSGDHYEKGAFLVHMIRIIMGDDAKFFAMLREMNKVYYHKIVTGKEIEEFISRYSGKDLSRFFDQYLRQQQLPVLDLKVKKGELKYQWSNCVDNFDMPVLVTIDGKTLQWIYPKTSLQTMPVKSKKVVASVDFLIETK